MSYRGFVSGVLMAMVLLVAGSVAAYEWEYLGMAGVSTTCIEADPRSRECLLQGLPGTK